MATTLSNRYTIDLPEWRILSQPVANNSFSAALGAGSYFAEDLRNNDFAHPEVISATSLTNIITYNNKTDAWKTLTASFGAGGTFGSGVSSVFVPSFSPSGTLAAGGSATKIVLSTALPASVAVNQLSNRGDGLGFIVRVIGNSAGGSGKTEERRVIANTSGTTPTIIVNEPFSFTPQLGDRYEFLSGSFLHLATGALTANQFRRYDVLTSSFSSLSTTGLIATVPATGNRLIPLEESYVPHNRNTGEGQIVGVSTYDASNTLTGGIKKCLLSTASAAGTLTGQASGGDAGVVANQYRNYQIRIVEDTAIPTAVGQRRRISSHTAGASPVYTLASNWSVTPSTACKYVIENWSDNIIALIGGTSTVYNYTISTNTWDTSTWAVKGNTSQTTGAFAFHAFGIAPDEINARKSSGIYLFRGATSTYDYFDIAGAATGAWTQGLSILDLAATAFDGTLTANDISTMAYNPHTQEGRYFYFTPSVTTISTANQRAFLRFDCISGKAEKIAGMRMVSGASAIYARTAWVSMFQDGATKVAMYNTNRPLTVTDFWQLMLIQ